MHSDRDALLAAIRANPEEDTPRLMFADWLDEQGDAASLTRAEFIRLQCEQARLADDGSDSHAMYAFLRDRYSTGLAATDWTRIDVGVHRLVALALRADDLHKQHGEAWLPKFPKKFKVTWDGFHRGFPHRVTLNNLRKLREVADRLRKDVPAITLVMEQFTSRVVEQFADADLLGCIAGLELSGECGPALREFGHRPEAAGVRAIKVRWSGTAGDMASALADSPHWTGLQTLDLSEVVVEEEAAETLFRAKNLGTLKRLHLYGTGVWGANTFRAFAAGSFAELTSLIFTRCGLDDDGAEVLAGCEHLKKLRTLDLDNNRITGRGATALLTSPNLANVVSLMLDANPCNGLDADRFAAAGPGALRMLHFHGSRLRTADVRALARCPRLLTLWYLDLDANNIGTPAVRELVRGFGKWCPPILWLTYNRIDDRGAELIANWKAATGLSALHLKYNPALADAGTRALLDSPHLTNLDVLAVSNIGDELEARIRARFRHHEVRY